LTSLTKTNINRNHHFPYIHGAELSIEAREGWKAENVTEKIFFGFQKDESSTGLVIRKEGSSAF